MESDIQQTLHGLVLRLPVLTTLCAAFFCWQLFSRYHRKGGGLHLLWWGIGMVTYGLGTATEAYTSIFGWHPFVFRSWYVVGAFLGGYPLAQGSIYLLMNRRFANRSAWIVSGFIAAASLFVFLTPLDVSVAEAHRLSGSVIEWRWVRLISPFINLYSLIFLAGGAVVSALRFRRAAALRHRYVGNILIALGALLPGIGGSMTRAGYVEVLYITELIGLSLIYGGYRLNVAGRFMPAQVLAPVGETRMKKATTIASALLLTLLLTVPAVADEPASEQESDNAPAAENRDKEQHAEDALESFFELTTVTATGTERDVLDVSTPVTVIQVEEIERKAPDSAVDLLREEPGVDVNGVGPNQARPVIRGQRGLRVLFLENGLRMNNARRQTDFGEISGLVDIDSVQTMEVVRGPASVLYGTDAIGGVLNLITKGPGAAQGFHGSIGLRHSSAGDQDRVTGSLSGRQDKFGFNIGVALRETKEYEAAAGTYGDITLDQETVVVDSGVEDDSIYGSFHYSLDTSNEMFLRFNRYRADQAGFGFVEPALLGDSDDFRIRILYPFQDFDRYTLGYDGAGLEAGAFDSLQVQAYFQQNERQLQNDIDIGPLLFGPFPANIEADTLNFTDLETFGARVEAVKVLRDKHLLTYGVEFFEDDSFNTDSSVTTTTLRFPFPPFEVPIVDTDDIANAPNATNSSYGLFAQGEIAPTGRLKVTLGARYQNIETRAEATPGWDVSGLDFEDDTAVGTVSAVYQATNNLNVVASLGTAFRAPNIIERLFNGPTPEGAGYQVLNPNLVSEESEHLDVGLKYRRRNAVFELIYFEIDINDGIVQHFLSPQERAELPQAVQDEIDTLGLSFVVQQRNIDRLRYEGVETSFGYRTDYGLSVGANYTHLSGKRLDSTNPPTGDTFADKYNVFVRYEPTSGRYWLEYRVRHNGDDRANIDPNEPAPPVGEILPSFTVQTLGGGVTLLERGNTRHELIAIVDNLTDELYAEFSNATFFRPEAKRSATVGYRLRF